LMFRPHKQNTMLFVDVVSNQRRVPDLHSRAKQG
jgi:hypothetical protein